MGSAARARGEGDRQGAAFRTRVNRRIEIPAGAGERGLTVTVRAASGAEPPSQGSLDTPQSVAAFFSAQQQDFSP